MADNASSVGPPHVCHLLVGLSGTGKSTIGEKVPARLEGCVFVDGDRFYRPVKPRRTLSDGTSVSDWDSADALDWDLLNSAIAALLQTHDVILATFLPRVDLYTFPVAKHIRLAYSGGSKEDDIARCIAARRVSKKLGDAEKQKRDEFMVREIVFPAYEHTCHLCPPDATVLTYGSGGRRAVEDVLADVLDALAS